MNWVKAIKKEYKREIADFGSGAIDGKTARRYFKAGSEGTALNVVGAYSTENRLVFGQVKANEKINGNEVATITAIPALLEKLTLTGCIVTIDAMGCHYEIAGKIVEKKANYLFSLKGHPDKKSAESLHGDVKEYFERLDLSIPMVENKKIQFQSTSTYEEKHGRIEDRDYAVSDDVGWLIERHPSWKSIRSIGIAESSRLSSSPNATSST